MKKRVIVFLLSLFILNLNLGVFAQSGRGRKPPESEKTDEPPPQKQPQQQPANTGPIPDGGKILKQEGDGVNSRYVLKNGLTIIIRESQAIPLAAVVTYVKASPSQADENTKGLSRLVSNLLYRKAAASASDGASGINAIGGSFSANASLGATSYCAVVPSQKLDAALSNQIDMLLHPSFDASEIKKAAAVAVQQARFENDDQSDFAVRRLYATAFPTRLKTAAADPGDSLKTVTPAQVEAYYRANYKPSNIVLSIAGAIRTSVIVPRIRQLYGALPTSAGAPEKTSAEPDQNTMNYGNDRADYLQSMVSIGYRVPELKSQESIAVEVLAAMIGKGYGRLLNRGSLATKGLITSTSADYFGLSDTGLLTVQLGLDSGKIDDAEAAYFGEIEKIRRDAIPEGELQRAQMVLEKKFVDQMSTVEGQALTLAHYQAQTGDFKRALTYVTQLRAVTSEQVQQVAAKYLNAANASVFEYEAKDAAPRTFPNAQAYADTVGYWIQGARRTTTTQNANKTVIDLQPMPQGDDRDNSAGGIMVELVPQPVRSFDTLHGPHVYVREDHSQPKITIGFYFQGGRVGESASDNGITGLMLRSMVRGSKEHPNVAIQLEQLGGTLEIINEPDSYGFSLDVLSRNAEAALRLLIDLIEHPAFDKVAVAREKALSIAELKQYADDNRQRPIDLFWHSLYPNHPYGRNPYGDEETIKNATEDSLKTLYAKTIQRQYPLAVLVGDTDGSSLVGRFLTDGFQRRETDQTLKLSVPALVPPLQPASENRGRKQTVQVIGFPGPKGDNADNAALIMIESLLSVGPGRLVDEVENHQGQAAVVRVLSEPRFLTGGFAVYAASSPENEAAVRSQILGQLQRLATEEISDQELSQARAAAIARYNVLLEQHPVRAMEYANAFMNKRKVEQVDTLAEQIKLVDKTDIKRVAAEYFKANQAAAGVIRGAAN